MDAVEPIGVFDSGIGGLTVLRELMREMPGENFVYLGDTARVPYGSRGKETVRCYALEAAELLVKRGIKYLVVACNTASALALDLLKTSLPIPVLGVVEPGAAAAVKTEGILGVIGTEGTVKSRAYPKAIHRLNPDKEVHQVACPLFVPLVEEGWEDREIAVQIARAYLEPLLQKGVHSLILGCTHYPVLEKTIHRAYGGLCLINPALETARVAREELKAMGKLSEGKGGVEYLVTDDAEKFQRVGNRLTGIEIRKVHMLSWKENEK